MAIISDVDGERYTPKKAAEHTVYQSIYARFFNGLYDDAAAENFPGMTDKEKSAVKDQINKLVSRILKNWT